MKKKIIILTCCIAILLIACQQSDDTETTKNDESTKNDDGIKASADTVNIPDATLQKGDQTDDVTSLQEVLIHLEYPIEATGLYNDVTTWAITDIQLQHESLLATGIYDEETKEVMEQMVSEDDNMPEVGEAITQPVHPNQYPERVENPYDILAVVNKHHALPNDYEPNDLVIPDIRFPFEEDLPKKYLRKVAADAIEQLFNAGDDAGVDLFGQSGFRSYDRQEAIFASNVAKNGEDHANTYSARAGESEHQTGLVMDVTSQAIGFDLNTDFGKTEEGIWLKEHAHEYGFIIRYPEEKEHITLYQYEPWHLRYVGIKAATEMYDKNQTLEEYFDTE